jgi:hypothetical protein
MVCLNELTTTPYDVFVPQFFSFIKVTYYSIKEDFYCKYSFSNTKIHKSFML